MNDNTPTRLEIQALPEGAATVLRLRREVDAKITRAHAEAAQAVTPVRPAHSVQATPVTQARYSRD